MKLKSLKFMVLKLKSLRYLEFQKLLKVQRLEFPKVLLSREKFYVFTFIYIYRNASNWYSNKFLIQWQPILSTTISIGLSIKVVTIG